MLRPGQRVARVLFFKSIQKELLRRCHSPSVMAKAMSSSLPEIPTAAINHVSDFINLANSIKIEQDCGTNTVSISLSEDILDERYATVPKKQKVENAQNSTTEDVIETSTAVPASVLEYERNLRKVQAEQRSVAALSMEKDLKVMYEDDHIIVVDKPSGVLCVPGINNKPNILQLVCQYRSQQENRIVEPQSDMIAHRLDMDTSGIVIFCKTSVALKKLQAAFRDRKVLVKEYHALVCGHLPGDWKSGHIHLPLQRDHRHPPFMRVATPRSEAQAHTAVKDLQTHGFKKLVKKRPKPSHTEFHVLQREYLEFPNIANAADEKSTTSNAKPSMIQIPVTRIALTPHTGRTHQLRVHCAALGYPIVGDPAYGMYGEAQARGGVDGEITGTFTSTTIGASSDLQDKLNRLRPLTSQHNTMCLHAAKLGVIHPITGEKISWTAATPF